MTARNVTLGAWSTLLVLPALFLVDPKAGPGDGHGGSAGLLSQLAWGDYDGDGLEDAYAILPSGQGGLLRGQLDGTLRDVTRAAGLDGVRFAERAVWGDLDGDGALDLVVETRAGTRAFRNVGGGRFAATTPVAPAAPATFGGGGAQHVAAAQQSLFCPPGVLDQADGTTCLNASTTPTFGMLYPLTRNLFVATSGRVGVNTTTPQARLHAAGSDAPGAIAEDAIFCRGGAGATGGRGATAIGGMGTGQGGDGLTAMGGRSSYSVGAGGAAIVGEGGYAASQLFGTGGAGARLTGGGVDPLAYATGGTGAIVRGGYVIGWYSEGGIGAEITGGGAPGIYGYAGDGAVITGGDGETAGDGAVITGGSGSRGGRGAIVRAGTGNQVREALRVEAAPPLNLAIDALGHVQVAGNVCATGTIGSCSDARFKTNVAPLADALATVLALRGVTYDWRVDAFPERRFTDERQLGFLAQEANEVVPEIVSRGSDGTYSIDYGKLTPLLVEALREQEERLRGLEARLADLESR